MKRAVSLRRYLLLGILVPVVVLVVLNSVSLYTQALRAVNTAYDRTLLASAKVIGEQLDVEGYDEQALLRATVPYSALEAFEVDNRSRLFYRVSSLQGEMVSGFAGLPFWRGERPDVFLDWYRRHAALLSRFFGSLEVVSVLLILPAAALAWWSDAPGRVLLGMSAVLTVAVLASFPVYFQAANARFASGELPVEDVPAALAQWATWHWVRTLAAFAAFALALAAGP